MAAASSFRDLMDAILTSGQEFETDSLIQETACGPPIWALTVFIREIEPLARKSKGFPEAPAYGPLPSLKGSEVLPCFRSWIFRGIRLGENSRPVLSRPNRPHKPLFQGVYGWFQKIQGPFAGVLAIRILVCRSLFFWGPLFMETPI